LGDFSKIQLLECGSGRKQTIETNDGDMARAFEDAPLTADIIAKVTTCINQQISQAAFSGKLFRSPLALQLASRCHDVTSFQLLYHCIRTSYLQSILQQGC